MNKFLAIMAVSVLCSSCGGGSGGGGEAINQIFDDLPDESAITQISDDVADETAIEQSSDDVSDLVVTDQSSDDISGQVEVDQNPEVAPEQASENIVVMEDEAELVADNQPVETITPFIAQITDPIWRVCEADVGTDSSDAWQNIQVFSSTRVCVKACPSDDSFIQDPNFPGLGWDNALSTACAVINRVEGTPFSTVPLYLPNEQPSRQTFTNIGAFQVHAGGGQWQCSHQQRNLSSDSFTDTGVEITYQFFSDGTANVRRNGGSEFTASWFFDSNSGTRIIGVFTGSSFVAPLSESIIPASYVGNVQTDTNSMYIYRNTVDRLSCTSERPADALTGFPESPEQVAELPVLLLDDLIDRPMSCTAYDALRLCVDCQSFTVVGESSDLEDSPDPVFININQSALTDASGQVRYEFQSDSATTYTVDEEGTFDSFFIRQGARSFADSKVVFSRFNDRIVMTENAREGGSGGVRTSSASSLCVAVSQ